MFCGLQSISDPRAAAITYRSSEAHRQAAGTDNGPITTQDPELCVDDRPIRQRLRKIEKILSISVGSGFFCSAEVWIAFGGR